MLRLKGHIFEEIKNQKVLITSLLILSFIGLFDRMNGSELNFEGFLTFFVEFFKILFCFSATSLFVVFINLFFKIIILKRTKEA